MLTRIRWIKIAVASIACIGFAQEPDRADDLQAPLWRLPVSRRVYLNAQMVEQSVKRGDPVRIAVTLRNVSYDPMGYGEDMGRPESDYIEKVSSEDGAPVPRVPRTTSIFGERGSGVRKTLGARSEVRLKFDLAKYRDLTRLGKYSVQVAKILYLPAKGATGELAAPGVVASTITE